MNRPREVRKSELATHTAPVTCSCCHTKYRPDARRADDLAGGIDPIYTLGWSCPNEFCEGDDED